MKERIKYAVARWSLWLSVAAFVVFVVALLSAAYNVALWAGGFSLIAWLVFNLFFNVCSGDDKGIIDYGRNLG